MAVARTVWFSFHLGCHRSAVLLSALNVSPLTQLPGCGDRTPASVPPPAKGRSSPTNTPIFPPVPSSYWVLLGSYRVLLGSIHSFPLFRDSYLFLAGVPHAPLCLKVYSWCIHGERCTPRSPTPLASCFSDQIYNLFLLNIMLSLLLSTMVCSAHIILITVYYIISPI